MTAGAIAVPTIVPLRAPMSGKLKNCIDSSTKIEISSATPGATVYYTTNGTKPNPFQPLGTTNSTLKYSGPILLSGGKVTVKALALSSDKNRESHVNTKIFDVEELKGPSPVPVDDENEFQEEVDGYTFNARKHAKSLMRSLLKENQAWVDVGDKSKTRNSTLGTRFSDARLDKISNRTTFGGSTVQDIDVQTAEDVDPYSRKEPKRMPPTSQTQALRLQRETDFLKCIYCFSPRPADPYSRFCNVCGNPLAPLPNSKIAPPEPGQVGMCVHCRAVVPFNVPSCLVCEAPIPPQNRPQASVHLANKLICASCGAANPSTLTACVMCEAKLPHNAKPLLPTSSAPPLPDGKGRLLACSKCSRVNNSDARFCDWCGAKPGAALTNLVCSKCSAHNQPYARFCGSCSVLLEPPAREDPRNSGLTVNFIDGTNNKLNSTMSTNWLPVSIPLPNGGDASMHAKGLKSGYYAAWKKPTAEAGTQTVGLFYPSNTEITKKQQEELEKAAYEKMMKDRRPLLTTVSPGRGYWRKQLDHICAHLRAHANNDTEFRALVGEPRMGKLINTFLHEDGHEMSLTLNFALRGNKDPYAKPLGLSQGDFLSTITARPDSLDSYRSESTVASQTTTGRRRKAKKKVKKTPKGEELSKETKALFKEVGKNGQGRPDEVERLLDEGGDASAVNKDGFPLLHIASMYKHHEAIPLIVNKGADVNRKGPQRGNTALHESIKLGMDAPKVVDALLGCGASQKKKNDKGETALDLAHKERDTTLINKFTANLGLTQLDKMSKTKKAADDEIEI